MELVFIGKPKSKSGLSTKQELTIRAFYNPNSDSYLNKNKSVLKYYNAKDSNSASTIASEVITEENLLKLTEANPELEIDPNLKLKLTKEWITTQILKLSKSSRNDNVKMRGLELLGKLRDTQLFSEHSVHENINSEIKSQSELDQEFRALIAEREKQEQKPD